MTDLHYSLVVHQLNSLGEALRIAHRFVGIEMRLHQGDIREAGILAQYDCINARRDLLKRIADNGLYVDGRTPRRCQRTCVALRCGAKYRRLERACFPRQGDVSRLTARQRTVECVWDLC